MDLACARLAALTEDTRACRVCRDAPRYGGPLPHEPRPVFQVSTSARLCIAGQAPGVRVHASGRPYTDPSGVRLRGWLGIKEEIFYDPETVAIVPMGFCFPGLDAKGGDLPPRRECAELWRERLFAALPNLELILLVGQYAQRWHLGAKTIANGLSETVGGWREVYRSHDRPRLLPMPHPSWRNNAWLMRNPWFETELLPVLRAEVARIVGPKL
jgi:uracil-DNA glycosylase